MIDPEAIRLFSIVNADGSEGASVHGLGKKAKFVETGDRNLSEARS